MFRLVDHSDLVGSIAVQLRVAERFVFVYGSGIFRTLRNSANNLGKHFNVQDAKTPQLLCALLSSPAVSGCAAGRAGQISDNQNGLG